MTDPGSFSLFDLFREEARAHAATLSQGLLELESDSANPQRLEPLMRSAHSIKGAARIVDIDPAVRLAHVMEDVFVAAQKGRITIQPRDIDSLLQGVDLLASLGEVREEAAAAWAAANAGRVDELTAAYQGIAVGAPRPSTEPSAIAPPTAVATGQFTRPTIVIPDASQVDEQTLFDVFREEIRLNSVALRDALATVEPGPASDKALGPVEPAIRGIKGAARIVGCTQVADVAGDLEASLAAAKATGTLSLSVVQSYYAALELFAELVPISEEDFGDWLAAKHDAWNEIRSGLQEPPAAPSPAAAAPAPTPAPVATETDTPALAPPPPPESAEAVVRVTAQSLNRLIGLAGESLVQARWLQPFASSLTTLRKQHDAIAGLLGDLAQAVAGAAHAEEIQALVADARNRAERSREVLDQRVAEFEDHSARAEDLNTRLYREVIVSRMRPFSDGALSFPRLVRDTARRLDKQVRFEMHGQATEVDRDILEKLEAPLTHLLRNAVDHGIEMPADRARLGKPEMGRIRIEVGHRAGMLAVMVSDDGHGIDLERLRQKVVERRLTTADVARAMSEAELLEFLFLPGFSTAGAVTEISGRGVGLDVVQTTIREVGGSVRITTTPGEGTRFHLKLPLTLSVLRAVLADIAGEPYAFPHNRIDRLLHVPRTRIRSLQHRQFTIVDDRNVGLVLAAQLMDLPIEPVSGDEVPVLLLSDQTGQYGLIVDRFRGEQDLVVRPLDPRLGKVPNVSAAAILDDGSPVLIADVEDMVRSMDRFIQTGSLLRCDRQQAKVAARKRVLVVDDSITVREVERQLLRGEGYDVETAVDGQDGLNLARSAVYDLIISDVDMPRMNGLQMVEAIRREDRLKHLPIVIVSYKERDEDRMRGLKAGASAYLTKSSFHDNTFLRTVADLVGGP
jgi:two-component system, chemotaxis family, sensor histidine kinase and response regulator WspE